MKKITYYYVYVYLLINEKKKYKELELAKLEFHITRNSSLVSSSTIEEKKKSIMLEFCIYKELELGKLEYCVAWNSSLPSSSSMWHFFNKKIHISTRSFMKLECFKTQFTQQTQVLRTRISKKWYIATYFANIGMLLIISAKSGKWPIWPKSLYLNSTQ